MTPVAARAVRVVLPGDVDDPSVPSGGNVYDRRICRGLARAGWSVEEYPITGGWPLPGPVPAEELSGTLAEAPDGAVVLLDGLVACGLPDVVVPQARRLRLTALVHLPLAAETGLAPHRAADLDRRERATLRAVDAVVATSRWTARRLVDHHGLAADRVHVAVPGVDPAPLAAGRAGGPGGDPPRLLCVAALTPRKGHDLLIEALAELADRPWDCVCAGSVDRDPGHVARLRAAADRSGLSGRVRFVGPRTGERLARAYGAADLVVLASRAETYGMVVSEALARGIPVVATAVGGVPEALGDSPDGSVPGMLVPPDDPAALAGGLRRWLDDPALRRRLAASARGRRAVLAGWGTTARQVSGVLERLLEEPGGTT